MGYDVLRTKACQTILGSTTKQRIEEAFSTIKSQDPLELICFGNSRIYRGVAIEHVSEQAYNFAFDGETFPQIYWKLEFLEDKGLLPDTIILGIDYWSFSSSSAHLAWYYGPYFGYSKLLEFHISDYLMYSKRLLKLYFQGSWNYIRSYVLGDIEKQRAILNSYGQYIFDLKHNPTPILKDRRLNMLTGNKAYFEAILNDFQNKCEIIVVQPPYRSLELNNMGKTQMDLVKKYFTNCLRKKPIPFFDFSNNTSSFSDSSFYDITHLRLEDSKRLGDLIRSEMNLYYE